VPSRVEVLESFYLEPNEVGVVVEDFLTLA
jgi:hypothetical protein